MTYFETRFFTDRQGKRHQAKPHIAYFDGENNRTRVRVLVYLKEYLPEGKMWAGIKQIWLATGTNYNYIKSRCCLWWKWRFIKRKTAIPEGGRPIFVYSIDQRGLKFLVERVPDWVLRRARTEIAVWQGECARLELAADSEGAFKDVCLFCYPIPGPNLNYAGYSIAGKHYWGLSFRHFKRQPIVFTADNRELALDTLNMARSDAGLSEYEFRKKVPSMT